MQASAPREEQANGEELPRQLSLLDSTMINVGSMIGSAIFMAPASLALLVHSSLAVILVWTVGGIVSLFGALSVAELGAMMPKAGGMYVYLREVDGPVWGYLYGWAAFACINTASIAAVAATFALYLGYFFPISPGAQAVVAIASIWRSLFGWAAFACINTASIAAVAATFALYLGYFFPISPGAQAVVAIASIWLLTALNCFGIRYGAVVQNGFTFLKIGSLALLILLSFILSGGSASNLSPLLPTEPISGLAGPLMLAMIAALFAYDGWIEITYVAGEVKSPGRNIPRSLFISTLIVIGIYVGVNVAFMLLLPLSSMAVSPMVASDADRKSTRL